MVIPASYLQLNFAKYKQSGKFGYKMIPPGKVQVPGFCNSDLYQDVIANGAKGLRISVSNENLSLIVSNGLIRDAPLPSGNLWTLVVISKKSVVYKPEASEPLAFLWRLRIKE